MIDAALCLRPRDWLATLDVSGILTGKTSSILSRNGYYIRMNLAAEGNVAWS